MTDLKSEIIIMQRRYKHLTERSTTIVVDLHNEASELSIEAAEIIAWLLERIKNLRRGLNEEIIDGQRNARDAYTQGCLDTKENLE